MKIMIMLLSTITLWANHQAITQVEYDVNAKEFRFTAVTYDEDEKVLETSRFRINFSIPIMWCVNTDEVRRYSEQERVGMLRNFQTVVEIFTQAVPNIGDAKLDRIAWNVQTKFITMKIGDRELRIRINGTIEENNKTTTLDKEIKQTLFAYSAFVMEYAAESVEWWDQGYGVPIILNGRKV